MNQQDAVQRVLAAAIFAAHKHSSQRRKGAAAEPYFNHLIEVAEMVSATNPEPDTELVIAALLHDSIEDAGVTKEDLTERFGADVARLVEEVTDDKSLPKAERKRLQIVNAPKKSVRAQAIKLADKISNLRAILSSPPVDWTEERKTEYFDWARQVVNGLTAPNPMLKTEFDRLINRRMSSTTKPQTGPLPVAEK
jgi:(p)ppGpp synthase/HD superfamily hydrolase